jgi:hypothetical protein
MKKTGILISETKFTHDKTLFWRLKKRGYRNLSTRAYIL